MLEKKSYSILEPIPPHMMQVLEPVPPHSEQGASPSPPQFVHRICSFPSQTPQRMSCLPKQVVQIKLQDEMDMIIGRIKANARIKLTIFFMLSSHRRKILIYALPVITLYHKHYYKSREYGKKASAEGMNPPRLLFGWDYPAILRINSRNSARVGSAVRSILLRISSTLWMSMSCR